MSKSLHRWGHIFGTFTAATLAVVCLLPNWPVRVKLYCSPFKLFSIVCFFSFFFFFLTCFFLLFSVVGRRVKNFKPYN